MWNAWDRVEMRFPAGKVRVSWWHRTHKGKRKANTEHFVEIWNVQVLFLGWEDWGKLKWQHIRKPVLSLERWQSLGHMGALKERHMTERNMDALHSFLLGLSFLIAFLHHMEGYFTNIASSFEASSFELFISSWNKAGQPLSTPSFQLLSHATSS